MKLIILSVIAAVILGYEVAAPCKIDSSSSYLLPPQCYAPAPAALACISKPNCFNPKVALYEKFPLLYKLYAKNCKLYCDKLTGVSTCLPATNVVTCATPAPVCVTPAPYKVLARPAPSCGPPPPTVLSPEVLNTLLAFSGSSSYPAPPLEPALSCACS